MSEPIREMPVDPLASSQPNYSFPAQQVQEPGVAVEPVAPAAFLPPRPVFPIWTFRDIAAVFGMAIFVLFACSAIALAIAHRLPMYRNVSVVVLAGSPLVIIGAQAVAYPLVLGFMVMLLRSRTEEPFFRAIRWNWPRSWAPGFFLLGIVLAFSVEALSSLLPIPKSLPIDKFFNSASAAYLMALFGTTLAPLMEEVFFRGLLYPWLRRTTGVLLALSITAAVFAAIHGAQLGYAWAPILGIFVVGLVLTIVRERAGSVAASFMTHCGYNFTLFILLWIGSDHFRHLEKIAS